MHLKFCSKWDDLRGGKSYRRFEGKSDLAISGGGVNRTDDFRVNRTWRFWGRVNRTDDLRVNRTWQFEGKSDLAN